MGEKSAQPKAAFITLGLAYGVGASPWGCYPSSQPCQAARLHAPAGWEVLEQPCPGGSEEGLQAVACVAGALPGASATQRSAHLQQAR